MQNKRIVQNLFVLLVFCGLIVGAYFLVRSSPLSDNIEKPPTTISSLSTDKAERQSFVSHNQIPTNSESTSPDVADSVTSQNINLREQDEKNLLRSLGMSKQDSEENEKVSQLMESGRKLTSKEIAQFESEVLSSPNARDLQIKLLGSCSSKRYENKPASKKCDSIALWLIENNPDDAVHFFRQTAIDPILSPDVYPRAVELWKNAVDNQPENLTRLKHAAEFFSPWNTDITITYLQRGKSLEPDNPFWSKELSSAYSLRADKKQLDLDTSFESDKTLALEESERALSLNVGDSAIPNLSLLRNGIKAAFDAGDFVRVKELAERLTQSRQQLSGDDASFAQVYLGRIALSSGNIDDAKSQLLNSAQRPGPVLKSFGPNLELARELLASGEKDTVIKYLDIVKQFWEPKQVDQWQQQIRSSGETEFERDYKLR